MKKLLSMLLSLAITVACFPVFAEETLQDSVNVKAIVESFQENETVLDMDFESDCKTNFGNIDWKGNIKTTKTDKGTVFSKMSNVATPWVKIENPITEGLVYINVDMMVPQMVTGKLSYIRLMSSPFTAVNVENDPYMAETFWVEQSSMNAGFYAASAGWTRSPKAKFETGKWYNIGMWLDLDKDEIFYFFDNEYMGSESSAPAVLTDLAGISVSATADIFLDNISFTNVSRSKLEDIKNAGVNIPDKMFESMFISAQINAIGNMVEVKNKPIPADISVKSIEETDFDVTAEITAITEDGVTIHSSSHDMAIKARDNTTLRIILPGVSRYGFYYMYVSLKDKATGKLYATENFRYALVRLPEKGLRNEKFGIINHVRHARMGDPLINLEFIEKAGFSTTRSEHTWATYETSPGQYKMTDAYARHIKAKTEKGIGHLEILAYENYAIHPESPPVSDEALDLFTDYGIQFTKELKEMMGDVPLEIEVWNEYNGRADYFNKSNQPPESYAKMLKAVGEKYEKYFPDMKIWGGATIGVANAWLERVVKAGGADYVYGISIHPYTNKMSPERGGAITQILDLKKMLAENGYPDMPLRATEWGWPSANVNGYLSENHQAAFLARMNVLSDHYGGLFERIDWYTINDGGEDMQNPEHSFGLLYGPNNKNSFGVKPGYLSATNFNAIMTDAQYIEGIETGECVSAYRYKLRDGRDCVISWRIDNGNEIAGLDLGCDKVTMVDMYGNEQELYAKDGVFTISYGIEPVYLIGDFDKVEGKEPKFALSKSNVEVIAGDKQEILVYQLSQTKGDISITESDDIKLYKKGGQIGTGTSLVLESKNCPTQYTNVGVTVKDAGKVVFTAKMPVSYADSVDSAISVRPKSLKDANRWEAVFSVKNNSYTEKIDAKITVTHPERIKGLTFDLNGISPGREESAVYNIPPYIVDNNNVDIRAEVKLSSGESYEIGEAVGLNSCAYMEKTPTIDGVFSKGEWNLNSAIDLESGGKYVYLAGEDYKGREDLSGKFYIAWDKDYFYLAANVVDDVFSDDKLEGGILWRSDGVQFAMAESRSASGVSQFDISKVGGVNKVQIDRHVDGLSGMLSEDMYELEIGREGNITTYELKLPWSIIFGENYSVQKNGELAMSFMVNENDGDVRRGYFEYGGGIGTGTADPSLYNKYYMLGSRLIDEFK